MPQSPLTAADVKHALGTFDWEKWSEDYAKVYGAWYDGVLHAEAKRTAVAAGAEWLADNPFVTKFAARYVAERVTQIASTTRDRLQALVAGYFEDATAAETGITLTDLAGFIRDQFKEFSTVRAQLIARTETAITLNHGALFGYVAAGFQYVEVSDGDDDDECAQADGQIWSIDYALANAIAHPNCVRSFQPIDTDEARKQGIDEE